MTNLKSSRGDKKKMNKILSLVLLLSTSFVFAQATDDNEVMITQTGDTLKLYIDQIGFGNKIGLERLFKWFRF